MPEYEDYAAEPISNTFIVEVLPPRTPNPFLALVGSVLDHLPGGWTLYLPEIGEATFDRQSLEGRGRITIRRRDGEGEYSVEKIDLFVNQGPRDSAKHLIKAGSVDVFYRTHGDVEAHWPAYRDALAKAIPNDKDGKGK
jgi:hypothetical protein